ncbi:MAG: alpha/beta fold hydrolase [Pyrinomonadaceae bacterium]
MANDCTSKSGLHCETYGSGNPVLCLHGLGASTHSWREFREPLAKQNKLFLLDFKGFGASPKPKDKHYAIKEHAESAYQFIVEQDLRNLTLIGSSFGGAVSLLVALRLCEEKSGRLRRLILIDSGGYNQHLPRHLKMMRTPILGWLMIHLLPPKLAALTVLKDSYYDDSRITTKQIEVYARPIADSGGRHALLQTSKQIIPEDIDELIAKYPKITVPTLIIWGGQDKVIPLVIGELLDEALPDSRLVVIDHSGHIPQEETPEAVLPLVLDFLKR